MANRRDIPDLPKYQVTDDGQVISFQKYPAGKVMSPYVFSNGLRAVHVTTPTGGDAFRMVGDLVLSAFVRPRQPGEFVRRHDGDNSNDRLDNLYWGPKPSLVQDRLCRSEIDLMRVQGMSLEEIGNVLCVSATTLSRFLNGVNRSGHA